MLTAYLRLADSKPVNAQLVHLIILAVVMLLALRSQHKTTVRLTVIHKQCGNALVLHEWDARNYAHTAVRCVANDYRLLVRSEVCITVLDERMRQVTLWTLAVYRYIYQL